MVLSSVRLGYTQSAIERERERERESIFHYSCSMHKTCWIMYKLYNVLSTKFNYVLGHVLGHTKNKYTQ